MILNKRTLKEALAPKIRTSVDSFHNYAITPEIAAKLKKMFSPAKKPWQSAIDKLHVPHKACGGVIPSGCRPAPGLVIGLNDPEKARRHMVPTDRPAVTVTFGIAGTGRVACAPAGFRGVWTQDMEDAFNNGDFDYLKGHGFTDTQRWSLANARDVNSRRNKPVKLKTIRAQYYGYHEQLFRDLIGGNHDKILSERDTRPELMRHWVEANLNGKFEWAGLNVPLRKVTTDTELRFTKMYKNGIKTYVHKI